MMIDVRTTQRRANKANPLGRKKALHLFLVALLLPPMIYSVILHELMLKFR